MNWNIIPLKLPDLKFNNIILKRVTELKFLGVMIDKNLNWQSHIKLVESKVSKNVGVLFKSILHLIRHTYQYDSHLYIYKYASSIGYGNAAWASISHNKHKKILSKNMLFLLYSWRKRNLCKDLLKRLSDNVIQILRFEHFWRNWTEVFNSFSKV